MIPVPQVIFLIFFFFLLFSVIGIFVWNPVCHGVRFVPNALDLSWLRRLFHKLTSEELRGLGFC